MSRLFWLDDRAWALIEPHMPKNQPGARRVDDRRVLPEAWVMSSTDFSKPVELDEYDGRTWGYRAGWWIVPRPEGPSDFTGIGHFGQFIYVSPQYDAVFVRTGPGRGSWGDRDWTELFYFAAERL